MADASTVHEEKKSAGKFATLWGKLGLDAGTLMMMAKYVLCLLDSNSNPNSRERAKY